MSKEYLITYEKTNYTGVVMQMTIPALTLFDAVDYAHNRHELSNIKEVRLA